MNAETTTTVQLDDGRIRVTRYDLASGSRLDWHRHEHDYLVVPLTDGTIDIVSADGRSTHAMAAGEPYRRPAGIEHELINDGAPYSFVEVEFLGEVAG